MYDNLYGSAGILLSSKVDVTGIFDRPSIPLISTYLCQIADANDVSLFVPLINTVLAR